MTKHFRKWVKKQNLSPKKLIAFKEAAKVFLGLSMDAIEIAIRNGDLMEVEL